MEIRDIRKEALKGSRLYSEDFLAQDGYVAGFMEAVEWFLESVWHDAEIEPAEEKMLVIINKNGEIKENDYMENKKYFVSHYTWKKEVKGEGIVKWAYKEDLIPNTED